MALDIANIKDQFKSIMDTANTTTASYDLSTSLDKRVQKVLTINPLKIPVQTTWYPYVTIYTVEKPIQLTTVGNQATAKRRSDIQFGVIGGIFEANIPTKTADRSDNQIEQLAENIEEILRSNSTLNNTVDWSYPTRTRFHNIGLNEETILRTAILSLVAKVYY